MRLTAAALLAAAPALADDTALAERAGAIADLRAWMGVEVSEVEVADGAVTIRATAAMAPDVSGMDEAARAGAVAFPLGLACNMRPIVELAGMADALSVAFSDPFGNEIGTYPLDRCADTPERAAAREARAALAADAATLRDGIGAALEDAGVEVVGLASGADFVTVTVAPADADAFLGQAERRERADAFLAATCEGAGLERFPEGVALEVEILDPSGREAGFGTATGCGGFDAFE